MDDLGLGWLAMCTWREKPPERTSARKTVLSMSVMFCFVSFVSAPGAWVSFCFSSLLFLPVLLRRLLVCLVLLSRSLLQH